MVTATGSDRHRLRRLGRADGVLVLNLHSVAPGRGRFTRPIPPEVFDTFVGWLKAHCDLTTFAGLTAKPGANRRPKAILSFDDGYADFLEYAVPILERHNVCANQNIVPSCVETGRPPWNVDLLDAIEHVPIDRLGALSLSSWEMPPAPASEGEMMRWGVAVSRGLKMRPRTEREALLAEFRAQLGGDLEHEPIPMMSAAEVAEVARLHEVGVHSYAHDSMEFESDDFFADDVRRCQDWYREKLASEPRVYAFPNGSYRESQIGIARQAGMDHVLLVDETTSSARSGVHPRITADGVSLRELRMRLARGC